MITRIIEAIGSDRYLHEHELPAALRASTAVADVWQVYQRWFGGFCEARLDPQFHRLAHPARLTGSIAIDPEDVVVVVGTGPSLHTTMPDLVRCRRRVKLFTSPRGADALAEYGVTPDLVLIEHQTALDAHHSARHQDDAPRHSWANTAFVAAEWRTPAALVESIDPLRLFVPTGLPTWGLWPATLVAMALDGGARRVALVGIDLGTPESPDPAFAPLFELLRVLAVHSGTDTVDVGGGAQKVGWRREPVEHAVAAKDGCALGVHTVRAPEPAERHAETALALRRLNDVVVATHDLLRIGLEARGGRADVVALLRAVDTFMAWGDDLVTRTLIQDTFGVSFLPRLWRLGIDRHLGAALWRPVVLTAHELSGQISALETHFEARAA